MLALEKRLNIHVEKDRGESKEMRGIILINRDWMSATKVGQERRKGERVSAGKGIG